MNLLVEERAAWVRTRTHTVVFDHEDDFARLRQNHTGELKRLVRIWLAENGGRSKQAYLGACQLCAGTFRWQGVRTILRRLRSLRGHEVPADELRSMCQAVLRCLREVASAEPRFAAGTRLWSGPRD